MGRLLHQRHLPIILLLASALAIGFLTVRDFSESWDEADIFRYGDYALRAYAHFSDSENLTPFDTNLNLYGPGYYMLADLGARGLMAVLPAWSLVNAWHFFYFLTFLAGTSGLYLLSRRWLSEWSSFAVTLLFLSQPLLWGHAFINPKDIPFMSIFTLAVYSGLLMVDGFRLSLRAISITVIAAVLLGLTAAFRAIGPLAGVIVLGYALWILRRRAILVVAIYGAVAVLTAYLSWPYLWPSTLPHYLKSLETMAQFPFPIDILFRGGLYKASELPWDYFPALLLIQSTEPLLLLVPIGLGVAGLALFRQRRLGPVPLFLAWFLAPAVYVVASRTPLYDNARQLFFLLPPVFIVAGVAFDRIFELLTRPAARVAVLLVAALPGILLSIRLHPYEYVYYNALVGGTGGAYGQYEMDYWGTSFKEIAGDLNAIAPPGASVLAFGPEQIIERYDRSDLRVLVPEHQAPGGSFDYAAILIRGAVVERRCKDAETVGLVERRGAIFAVLKAIPPGAECR